MARSPAKPAALPLSIRVPYYAQTSDFSCGPACALMALAYFDRTLPKDRRTEFGLWRETNLIAVRGTDPYGLAIPFLRRGYRVRGVIEPHLRFRRSRLKEHLGNDALVRLAYYAADEVRREARSLGLEEVPRIPDLQDVRAMLEAGSVPLALVHMGIVHDYDVPHWVVVTGLGDGWVRLNDPYPPKGRRNLEVSTRAFLKMLADVRPRIGMPRSILEICAPESPRSGQGARPGRENRGRR